MSRPLRVLSAQDDNGPNIVPTTNLPVQLTSLVGREDEVQAARAMLEQPHIRLLTLTGPPGVGKTRLGIEIASALANNFPDGVYFVPLAPIIGDSHLVISTIVQVLSIPTSASQTIYASLENYLADKSILLLLDNFEQVVEAASYVGDLLVACPALKVLVTSRELLRLYGEHTLPVPPLALPDLEHLPDPAQLISYEAVALFVQRAQASRPDFSLTSDNAPAVAEICTRLDGLPLAIELAAARVRLMPPQALLPRLSSRLRLLTSTSRNRPLRQQTLRAAIDWGYDLLSDDEKILFRRLAAFVGGCALEAAEAVCGSTGEDTLTLLEALLDKSMLRQQSGASDEPRFWMLETIREYGLESMAAVGELAEITRRHANYFLALAEQAEHNFAGSEQALWTRRLRAEHDNFRAVLHWSQSEAGDLDIGLRLAGVLGWYWRVSGFIAEGRDQLVAILSQVDETDNTSVDKNALARACHMVGWLAFLQGDNDAAQAYCRKSLELYRELGNKTSISAVLIRLGAIVTQQGNYAEARALAEEGLLLARQMEDTYAISTSLNVLGELFRLEGDYVEARAKYEESLLLKRRLGGKMGIAVALHNLAHVAHHNGDLDYSYDLFAESLGIFRELASTLDIAMCVAGLGGIAAARGEAHYAAILLGAVGAHLREIGASVWPADRSDYERYLSMTRSQLSDADFDEAWQTGQSMTPEEAFLYVESLRSAAGKLAAPSAKSAPNGDLTAREIEVIALLERGLTNAEMASSLVLSRRTVHAHLQSIYSKLGVNTRTAAVSRARDLGLLS